MITPSRNSQTFDKYKRLYEWFKGHEMVCVIFQSFIYFVCRGYSHPEEKVAHVFKKLQGYLAQVANSRFDFVKEIYRQDSIKVTTTNQKRFHHM